MKQQISENGELKRFSAWYTIIPVYKNVQRKYVLKMSLDFQIKKSINRKQTVIFFIYKDYKHKSNT